MATYKRKPDTIEAEQFFPNKGVEGVYTTQKQVPVFDEFDSPWETVYVLTMGPGSETQVYPGDWIITNVYEDGKFRRGVCRDEYFRREYEEVTNA